MCQVFKQIDKIRQEIVALHNTGYHAEALALDATLNKIETAVSNQILGKVLSGITVKEVPYIDSDTLIITDK